MTHNINNYNNKEYHQRIAKMHIITKMINDYTQMVI